MITKAITTKDDAASKFGKLLPSEVTALYLSMRPLVVGTYPKMHLALTIVSLILAVIFIRRVRKVESWGHTLIYALTFCVWVMTLESEGMRYWLTDQWHIFTYGNADYAMFGAITSILWTFVVTNLVPISFVTTDKPKPGQKPDAGPTAEAEPVP